uniref:MLLT1 super elongation complex subunit a n=1 Tax=Neogobius melanostomus TaxID=47308 RepID=A0A8C6V142_9GOBI
MDNRPTRGGVKLELGHRAQLRKKITSEGFTHDWMVFVRGPETGDIQHFVEKVVFRLHESFPKPKRVCKEPPYKVEESGYAGFLMPIEVYFKNKEEPKKVLNHLRCEKLTFNNPTKEFRRKLIKAGGVLVVPEGAEAVSRPSPDYPILPTIPSLPFQTPRRQRPPIGSSKGPKPHKLTKEHRERPRKDSESKATSKDSERDGSSKSSRDPSSSSKKPSDVKVKDEVKVLPKAAFKEPKLTLKESKMEGMSPKGGVPGQGAVAAKAPGKRPSTVESPKPSNKKQKKGSSEGPKGAGSGGFTGSSPRVSSSSAAGQPYAEKKPPKDKGAAGSKARTTRRKSKRQRNCRSPRSPTLRTRRRPSQRSDLRPLRSMVEEIQSEESDDDDSSSEEETPVKTNPGNSRSAYTEELVDLHRRLMALRERNVLQQIVNLIEETGHFNVTNTTFDFDLFSLDESTVRKLQSYLEATAT